MSRREICLVTIICILMIGLTSFYMSKDHYWNADETITYGMSNSYQKGWMLSQGRVVAYLQDHVIGDSAPETLRGLKDFVFDILKNRREAQYFSYPRPSETGWYSREEVHNWSYVSAGERFKFGSVYLNAMGDDANSFLYEMLVHFVGSLFPSISGTSWAGFIVNISFAIAVVWVLWFLTGRFGLSLMERAAIVVFYAFSMHCIEFATLSRAYMGSTFFHILLIDLHVLLMQAIKNSQIEKAKRYLLYLVPTYALGYVMHYTILFFAGTVGIAMIVWFLQGKYPLLKNYIIAGVGSVVLGVILDPVSVMGMLMKLGGVTERSNSVFHIIRESLLFYLAPDRWILLTLSLLVLVSLGMILVRKIKGREASGLLNERKQLLFWLAPLAMDMVVVSVATTKDYFKSLYPMIMLMVIVLISTAIKYISLPRLRCVIQAMAIAFLGVVLLCGFVTMGERKESEEMYAKELRETLDDNMTSKAILVRDHACGYTLLNELYRYDDTLVLTAEEGELTSLNSFGDKVAEEETLILLVDCERETTKPFFTEIVSLGYQASQLWSDDGTMGAYLLTRQ